MMSEMKVDGSVYILPRTAADDEWHEKMEQENAELREYKEEVEAQFRKIMDEKCAKDEAHCTCVPFLRMEVEGLKLALDGMTKQANEVTANWKKAEERLKEYNEIEKVADLFIKTYRQKASDKELP